MAVPCKDCQKRKFNCHSTCEDYLKFKNKSAIINHKAYIERELTQAQIELERHRQKTRRAFG